MGAISQAHFWPVSFCFLTKSRLRSQVNRCKLLTTWDLSSPASYKCYYGMDMNSFDGTVSSPTESVVWRRLWGTPATHRRYLNKRTGQGLTGAQIHGPGRKKQVTVKAMRNHESSSVLLCGSTVRSVRPVRADAGGLSAVPGVRLHPGGFGRKESAGRDCGLELVPRGNGKSRGFAERWWLGHSLRAIRYHEPGVENILVAASSTASGAYRSGVRPRCAWLNLTPIAGASTG